MPTNQGTSADLLYVTPVIPARTGNGLAMRAGAVLRALARHFRVYLLVIPLYTPVTPEIPTDLASLCVASAAVPFQPPDESRRGPFETRGTDVTNWVKAAGSVFAEKRFDIIHHFRLITVPFGMPYRHRSWAPPPKLHLDLDEVESVAGRRLAELYRLNGRFLEAEVAEQQAEQARDLEDAALREFDRIYVSSAADHERLRLRSGADLRLLPNTVDLPADPGPPPAARSFELLYVGTLGYFPNEDAVLFFQREVLPILRTASRRPFRLSVLGRGAPPSLLAATHDVPEVEVAGAVDDLAPWYARANAVVVPLRCGGGTRIKILEAFAQRRAVVSTTAGAEGLDARQDEHLLIADSPAGVAAACLRLMHEPALAERLAAEAYDLVRRRYMLENLSDALIRA